MSNVNRTLLLELAQDMLDTKKAAIHSARRCAAAYIGSWMGQCAALALQHAEASKQAYIGAALQDEYKLDSNDTHLLCQLLDLETFSDLALRLEADLEHLREKFPFPVRVERYEMCGRTSFAIMPPRRAL